MKHYLNVCYVDGSAIEPVDIITFGSPCQDLSIAGKRAGLKHETKGDEETTRSGLFMEAIRIIKEMRKATDGKYPTFALWENVPGAFSSNKGEDFRIVLEEIIKIKEQEIPPLPKADKAGWPYADCIVGDGWSVAWRVFDAQYWGVPQRRRRIALVADFAGERAREILFECESLRGDTAESGTERERTTSNAQDSTGTGDTGTERNCLTPWDIQAYRIFDDNGTWPAVCTRNGYICLPFDKSQITCPTSHSNPQWGNPCHTLTATSQPPTVIMATQQGGSEISENGICPTITASAGMSGNNQPVVCLPDQNDKSQSKIYDVRLTSEATINARVNIYETDTSRTIDTCGNNPNTNQGGIVVVQSLTYDARGNGDGQTVSTITGDHENRVTDYTALICEHVYCLQGNGIDRSDTAGCNGKGWKEDKSYTLNTVDRPAVAYAEPLTLLGNQVAGPIMARDYKGVGRVDTLNSVVCVPNEKVKYIIRRLTPTECARLQGFPDTWSNIDKKEDFTEKEYKFWLDVRNTHAEINGKTVKKYTKAQMLSWYNKLHSDSSEYKMWGNGVALPFVRYPLGKMSKLGAKTLGSLFDGSGGFPLAGILEGVKPLWASEIEPYPIAVTKSRFKEGNHHESVRIPRTNDRNMRKAYK